MRQTRKQFGFTLEQFWIVLLFSVMACLYRTVYKYFGLKSSLTRCWNYLDFFLYSQSCQGTMKAFSLRKDQSSDIKNFAISLFILPLAEVSALGLQRIMTKDDSYILSKNCYTCNKVKRINEKKKES